MRPIVPALIVLILAAIPIASGVADWVTFPGRGLGITYSYFRQPSTEIVRSEISRRVPIGTRLQVVQNTMKDLGFRCNENAKLERLSCSRVQMSIFSGEWNFVFFFLNGNMTKFWYFPAVRMP